MKNFFFHSRFHKKKQEIGKTGEQKKMKQQQPRIKRDEKM